MAGEKASNEKQSNQMKELEKPEYKNVRTLLFRLPVCIVVSFFAFISISGTIGIVVTSLLESDSLARGFGFSASLLIAMVFFLYFTVAAAGWLLLKKSYRVFLLYATVAAAILISSLWNSGFVGFVLSGLVAAVYLWFAVGEMVAAKLQTR